MQIAFNPTSLYYYKHSNPSFKAMKKSEFSGIDRFVVEKYNAPIETFNGHKDFNKYCTKSIENIKDKNFEGKDEEAKIQRKAMLDEWYKYVTIENQGYTPAIQFMILKGITNSLKPNEDTLPPVLDKRVLADTVAEVEEETQTQKDPKLNFDKLYRNNLQKSIFEEEENNLDESLNGWIIIPSQKNDPKNFESNVAKLKILSYKTWCTKSYNARPYLEKGNFHVYIENGVPTIGVRFVGDKIEEIQGKKNNSKIPLDYYDVVKSHIKGCKLTDNAKEELNTLERLNAKVKKLKEKFPNGINNLSTEEIFDELSVEYKKLEDGMLEISSYDGTGNDIPYSDLGIDENKLFKNIKRITRSAKFKNSEVTNLGNLEYIGRFAEFKDSKITDLGKLKSIGWNADFRNSKITDLGNLEYIGWNADFRNSQVINLGNLKYIGRDVDFKNSKITDLGNLEYIGRDAILEDSQVTSLGKLKFIGRDVYYNSNSIAILPLLESIIVGRNIINIDL